MTKLIRYYVALAALTVAPATTFAQEAPARPQPSQPAPPPTMAVGPQIQRIETASAVSKELLSAITSVRELPDGRVLVNDGTRRRLLLMDTMLTTVEVVLDSMAEIANTYGTRPGALLPFRGDTTLFVDPASLAVVMIDPQGKLGRVRSVWRAEHVQYFSNSTGTFGHPGVDAKGRIIYRVRAVPAPPAVRPPAGVPYFPTEPDSAFVVAADLDTRKIDTLAVVRIPKSEMRVHRTADNRYSMYPVVNPLPMSDHWAVLPDGTVAILRALDYRIEYLNPDLTWSSSAKLPYEWMRLNDEDKQRMADSTRAQQLRFAQSSYVANVIMWVNSYGKAYPPGFTVPEGVTLQPGMPKDWILPEGMTFPENYIYACAPGQQPPTQLMGPIQVATPPGAPAGPSAPTCFPAPTMFNSGGQAPPFPTMRPVNVTPPGELPDYRPPFPTGAVGAPRADMEGNLWVRTVPSKPIPGGVVYDIVSRAGELVNRIQLPPGYTLLGFGRGKIVYLSMRDATGLHLARVRLR